MESEKMLLIWDGLSCLKSMTSRGGGQSAKILQLTRMERAILCFLANNPELNAPRYHRAPAALPNPISIIAPGGITFTKGILSGQPETTSEAVFGIHQMWWQKDSRPRKVFQTVFPSFNPERCKPDGGYSKKNAERICRGTLRREL